LTQSRRDHPHDTLEQLESLGDRLAQAVAAKPLLVLGVMGAILLLAAATGGLRAWHAAQEDAASTELARIHAEYLRAMGGEPGDLAPPEPANPETARSVRSDFVQRFVNLARERAGTPTAALARLEASEIYRALGAPDQAVETLEAAGADLPQASSVRAVVLTRLAGFLEERSDFAAAARSYEVAATIEGYPLRHAALADAARCWAEAGDSAAAVAAYDRLRAQAPDFSLAPHVEARLKELRPQP
jgi:tetratricopeptide (TPR) repeat protein